jgi:hypothetical protein
MTRFQKFGAFREPIYPATGNRQPGEPNCVHYFS